jgi:hypothetical protein
MSISRQDAWALKRALTRNSLQDVEMSAGVAMILKLIDPNTPEGWARLSDLINADPQTQAAVLAEDPKTPPAKLFSANNYYVPPLKTYARLSEKACAEAAQVGSWLNDYMAWAVKRSPMTPPIFLEAGGLWLIGLAVARRVCIQIHDRVYPHLYILWVATTTRYAKSTGLSAVNHVARAAMPHMIMPQESTPEALVESMAGKLPDNFTDLRPRDQSMIKSGQKFAAQRGLLIDEASSLLGAAKKDYMAGLQEWLLQAYDAPDRKERNTRGGGMVIVRRIALSILGATTPAAMGRTVTADRWEDGEMARYALLFPEDLMKFDDSIGDYDPPPAIVEHLRNLHDILPQPKEADFMADDEPEQVVYFASMTDAARTAFRAYRKAMTEMVDADLDVRLHGNYGRLPVQALKVALALACSEWLAAGDPQSRPVITLGCWAKAQTIVESWRASVHRLLPVLSESLDSRTQTRVLALLKTAPGGLTLRDISRSTGVSVKHLHSALDVLIESSLIEAVDWQNPSGGPKTKIYQRVVSADSAD